MENLARATADEKVECSVLRELERCRIPAIKEKGQGEVPYRHIGKLGDFTFRRAWGYWVVKGPVPIEVAKELYDDVVGRTDIRVDGHCGCPAPELPWVTYYDKQGRKLYKLKKPDEQKREEALLDKWSNEDWRTKYTFVEDPAAVAVQAVVEMYHIDTEQGLRIFVNFINPACRAGHTVARVLIYYGLIAQMHCLPCADAQD